MKKIVLFLLILHLCLFFRVYAQNKWFIYLQVGPNLSFIYNSKVDNPVIWGRGSWFSIPLYPCNKLKFGGTCGIGVKYEMHANWALKMSVNFSQKGGRGHINKYELYDKGGYDVGLSSGYSDPPVAVYDIDADIYFTYQYLTIPLQCQWQFKGFFINAGMFLAVPLNSFTYSTFDLNGKECTYNENLSNRHFNRKIDFGIICGLGYKFTITEKDFIVAELTSNTSLLAAEKKYEGGVVRNHKPQCFDLLLKYERRLK